MRPSMNSKPEIHLKHKCIFSFVYGLLQRDDNRVWIRKKINYCYEQVAKQLKPLFGNRINLEIVIKRKVEVKIEIEVEINLFFEYNNCLLGNKINI